MVDVPAKPRSTRQSTVASSSRARISRVRSSWGTRVVPATVVTGPASWLDQQTVKPDFLCWYTSRMTQTILITGASSGLGEEMARQFAARGYDLALCARRLDRLEALRDEIAAAHPDRRVEVRTLDVCDDDEVFEVFRAFRSDFGSIDRIVVNAGIGKGAPLGTGRYDANRETAMTNFVAALAQARGRDGDPPRPGPRPAGAGLVDGGDARAAEGGDDVRRDQGGGRPAWARACRPSSTAPRSRSPCCTPATSCRG